jgi:transcriptional regulator with XRE-family HTH domain
MGTENSKKIRVAMILAGISGAQIARTLKMDRSAVNKVVAGERKTLRIRKAVADAINTNINDLWPDAGTSR